MENLDFIPIFVSVVSLILSGTVAYFSHFRAPRIKMLVGKNIMLFPSKVKSVGDDILGVTFNIPLTFYNWSPQGGTIYRIRLLVGRVNQGEYYDMTWTTFVKISRSGNFEDEDLARPIPIEARSSLNKTVRFDWNPEFTGEALEIQKNIKYELRIFAWAEDKRKPNLGYSTSFILKEREYEQYQSSISSERFNSVFVALEDDERPNTVITRARLTNFYLNQH